MSGRQILEWIKTHPKCQAKEKEFLVYVWSKKEQAGRDSPYPLALGRWCSMNKELKGGRMTLISSRGMVFTEEVRINRRNQSPPVRRDWLPNIDLYIFNTLYLYSPFQLQRVLIAIVNKFNLINIYWALANAKQNHFAPFKLSDMTSKVFPKYRPSYTLLLTLGYGSSCYPFAICQEKGSPGWNEASSWRKVNYLRTCVCVHVVGGVHICIRTIDHFLFCGVEDKACSFELCYEQFLVQ